MEEENLETKCRKAVLSIAADVKEINKKLSHFIENYREDYYKALDGIWYQGQYK